MRTESPASAELLRAFEFIGKSTRSAKDTQDAQNAPPPFATPPAHRTLDETFAIHSVTKAELKERFNAVNAELDLAVEELQCARRNWADADEVHADHMAASEAQIRQLADDLA